MTTTEDTPISNNKLQTVHVLITQCLQNGFFLSESNRLRLPKDVVHRILIGKQSNATPKITLDDTPNRRKLPDKIYQKGPLYQFLQTVIEKPKRQDILHVIHLKDWHELSSRYDDERRKYGGHCEANTWEANPIDGYEAFLKPWNDDNQRLQARSLKGYKHPKHSKVRFYEVLSDTVFDFKRSQDVSIPLGKDIVDRLENSSQSVSHLSIILEDILNSYSGNVNVYVTVIGVYTDIKIRTLLTSLKTRYDLNSLIVSDVLTGSVSLERHLEGLDFCDKVLGVEIVSDLNTIVGILDRDTSQPEPSEEKHIPFDLTSDSVRWRNYRNYFLDKQNVLAFRDDLLGTYLKLTEERNDELYEQMKNSTWFLDVIGKISIVLLLIFAVLAVGGVEVNIAVFVAIGLGSLAQIVPLLLVDPQKRVQKNLFTIVRLRNYLESYSITSALLRHHLTTPEQLEPQVDETAQRAKLSGQLEIIQQAGKTLRENFEGIVKKSGADDNNETVIPG